MGKESQNIFGGDHTEYKLTIVKEYLTAYTRVFSGRKQMWATTLYLDPFAGTGYRDSQAPVSDENTLGLPLPQLKPSTRRFSGSAILALRTNPPFAEYHFCDKRAKNAKILANLKRDFPNKKIFVESDDANACIMRFCARLRGDRNLRSVVFLDPYGMQVNWASLEALARTQRADVWCLVPMSGLIRQLSHNKGKIDEHKAKRLDAFLGTPDWRKIYEAEGGVIEGPTGIRDINIPRLEGFVLKRLRSVFSAGWVSEPFPIYERTASGGVTKQQKFSLFYALANPGRKPKDAAKRIVEHLGKKFKHPGR